MEETLGKRISGNRKRLGLTQDQLAERLGVTAQAVSKWENDQSCPDIQTLPKLAEIFETTTDELLGMGERRERKTVHAGEVCGQKETDQDCSNQVEVSVNSGRRFTLGLAVCMLLTGVLLIILKKFLMIDSASWNVVWNVFWPAGLLVFGVFGLYPRFSVFRLGCALLGAHYLAAWFIGPSSLGWPVLLLVLGGLLLIEALRGRKKGAIHVPIAGNIHTHSSCEANGEEFHCIMSFGESRPVIDLRRLSRGSASVSFGELGLDLRNCGEIADGCTLNLDASFGEMKVILPGNCRVQSSVKTSFGDCKIEGEPDADAEKTVYVTGSVSFGEMCFQYQ